VANNKIGQLNVSDRKFNRELSTEELHNEIDIIFGKDVAKRLDQYGLLNLGNLGAGTAGVGQAGKFAKFNPATANMKSRTGIAKMILHEIGTHVNIREFLGDTGWSELKTKLNDLYNSDAKIQDVVKKNVVKHAKAAFKSPDSRVSYHSTALFHLGKISFEQALKSDAFAEEATNYIFQNFLDKSASSNKLGIIVSDIIAGLKSWLISKGLTSFSDAHILTIVRASLQDAIEGNRYLERSTTGDYSGAKPANVDPNLGTSLRWQDIGDQIDKENETQRLVDDALRSNTMLMGSLSKNEIPTLMSPSDAENLHNSLQNISVPKFKEKFSWLARETAPRSYFEFLDARFAIYLKKHTNVVKTQH